MTIRAVQVDSLVPQQLMVFKNGKGREKGAQHIVRATAMPALTFDHFCICFLSHERLLVGLRVCLEVQHSVWVGHHVVPLVAGFVFWVVFLSCLKRFGILSSCSLACC